MGRIIHPSFTEAYCVPHTSRAFVAHTQPPDEGRTTASPLQGKMVAQERLVQGHLPSDSSTTRTQDTLVVSTPPQGMRLGSSEVCNRLSQLPSYLINLDFRLYYFRLPEKLKEHCRERCVVVCTCYSSTGEAKARGSLRVQSQPALHSVSKASLCYIVSSKPACATYIVSPKPACTT